MIEKKLIKLKSEDVGQYFALYEENFFDGTLRPICKGKLVQITFDWKNWITLHYFPEDKNNEKEIRADGERHFIRLFPEIDKTIWILE